MAQRQAMREPFGYVLISVLTASILLFVLVGITLMSIGRVDWNEESIYTEEQLVPYTGSNPSLYLESVDSDSQRVFLIGQWASHVFKGALRLHKLSPLVIIQESSTISGLIACSTKDFRMEPEERYENWPQEDIHLDSEASLPGVFDSSRVGEVLRRFDRELQNPSSNSRFQQDRVLVSTLIELTRCAFFGGPTTLVLDDESPREDLFIWSESALRIEGTEELNCRLTLLCTDSVFFQGRVHIRDVVAYATGKITVKDHCSLQGELISKEGIQIQDHSTLVYPSIALTIHDSLRSSPKPMIAVSDHSTIEGALISYEHPIGNGSSTVGVLFSSHSAMLGGILSNTPVEVVGEIKGFLCASEVLQKRNRINYINNMDRVRIDRRKLPPDFPLPPLFSDAPLSVLWNRQR